MNIRISRLLDRFKRLAIGEPKTYTGILSFLDNDKPACRYWTQPKLQEFAAVHPEQDGYLCVGCPKAPEDRWCIFGSGDVVMDETVAPRDCPGCEYFGMKD